MICVKHARVYPRLEYVQFTCTVRNRQYAPCLSREGARRELERETKRERGVAAVEGPAL